MDPTYQQAQQEQPLNLPIYYGHLADRILPVEHQISTTSLFCFLSDCGCDFSTGIGSAGGPRCTGNPVAPLCPSLPSSPYFWSLIHSDWKFHFSTTDGFSLQNFVHPGQLGSSGSNRIPHHSQICVGHCNEAGAGRGRRACQPEWTSIQIVDRRVCATWSQCQMRRIMHLIRSDRRNSPFWLIIVPFRCPLSSCAGCWLSALYRLAHTPTNRLRSSSGTGVFRNILWQFWVLSFWIFLF